MKVGDLVNFYSGVSMFQKDYCDRNPGVIIAHNGGSVTATKAFGFQGSAYILWANGEMTKEYDTYLETAHEDR